MRKQSFLSRMAASTKRKGTINTEKEIYKMMWGSTPEKDRAKTRRKKNEK